MTNGFLRAHFLRGLVVGGLAAAPGVALGVSGLLGLEDVTYAPDFTLTSVGAVRTAGGVVRYTLSGFQPGNPNLIFRAKAAWDPNTGRAAEEISFGDSTILAVSFCPADPWIQDVPCTRQTVSTRSDDQQRFMERIKWGFPVSARVLHGSRAQVKAALDAVPQTPTPTPIRHVRVIIQTPTPTPTPIHHARAVIGTAPAYGASYTPDALPSLRVGQTVTVRVSLRNLGSRTWLRASANPVHLSYHWAQSGSIVVTDGARTFLSADVPPAGIATLSATVTAPPSPGAWTLQWDLVEENIAWFSWKGVPTKDQNVNVTP
ncbi:MAG: hypothetical protein WCC53_03780 [Thermoanaerobaculia bacterium]|jgi:hypothetical protein